MLVCVVCVGWALPVMDAAAEVRVCTYNLLQFGSAIGQTRLNAFKTVVAAINPDVIVVQEVETGGETKFLVGVLDAQFGDGVYEMARFTDGPDSDNALYYKPTIFTFTYGGPDDHTDLTTSPRHTDRWRLRSVLDPSGQNDLYVYSMHLKAGDSSEEAQQRAASAAIIRADTEGLPAGAHFVLAGDFNLYASTEDAYQILIGLPDNNGRAYDPINAPGAWHDGYSFRFIHTQSPHNDNDGAPSSATGGGLDDRFDFLLVSNTLRDSAGMDYITGTYKAFGQDGSHYNNDINDPPTIPEGQAMADALHAASDHLPVYMNLSDPAEHPTIGPIGSVSFGLVLVGGTAEATITVENTGTPTAPDLVYSFETTTGFSAPEGTFSDPPGGGGSEHVLTMTGLATGNQYGTLTIANNSANDPEMTVSLNGGVLRHAIPSTVSNQQVLTADLDFGEHPVGSFSDANARVYNANYHPILSVPLAVYDATISDNTEERFNLVGFVPVEGITSYADFPVHFDDTGAAPGYYLATIRFLTRDDSVLPGAMELATVTYHARAIVPTAWPRGDLNRSGAVDLGDVVPFVTLLLDPAAASSEDRLIADVNDDSANDGRDIQGLTDALVTTP